MDLIQDEKLCKIKYDNIIGYGFTSIVYKYPKDIDDFVIKYPKGIDDFVIKRIFLHDPDAKNNELNINYNIWFNNTFKSLRKYSVEFYSYCKTSKELLIKFEYIKSPSLYDYIFDKVKNKTLSYKEIKVIVDKISNILLKFHNLGIYHNDVHISNFFIIDKDTFLISDWGKGSISRYDFNKSQKEIEKFKNEVYKDIKFMNFMKDMNYDYENVILYLKDTDLYDKYINLVNKETKYVYEKFSYKKPELLKEIEKMIKIRFIKEII